LSYLPLVSLIAFTMANNVVVSGITVRNSASVQQLASMPVVRVPVLRTGRTVVAGRVQNNEAHIAQMRGVENVGDMVCRHCKAGHGPWAACVSVNGLFAGSCCNCHYNSSGARCSIRQLIANVQAAKTAAAVPAPVIPGMAPANNFGGSLSTPSPVTRASRRSRRITVTPVGPVGSFQPGGQICLLQLLLKRQLQRLLQPLLQPL
ncbi:hypothetical protein DH86_00004355, partial [Scytalidium sp. 3C]